MDFRWRQVDHAPPTDEERAASPLVIGRLQAQRPEVDFRLVAQIELRAAEAGRIVDFWGAFEALLRDELEPMRALVRDFLPGLEALDGRIPSLLSDPDVPLARILEDAPPVEPPPGDAPLPTELRIEGMSERVPNPSVQRLHETSRRLRGFMHAQQVGEISALGDAEMTGAEATRALEAAARAKGVPLLTPDEIDHWSAEMLLERERFWQQTLRWWSGEWALGVMARFNDAELRDYFVSRVLAPLLAYVDRLLRDGSLLLQDIAVSNYEVRVQSFRYLDLVVASENDAEMRRRAAQLGRWLRFYVRGRLIERADLGEGVVERLWGQAAFERAFADYEHVVAAAEPAARVETPDVRADFERLLESEVYWRVHTLAAPEGRAEEWRREVARWLEGRASDVLAEARRAASHLFWASRGRRNGVDAEQLVRQLYAEWGDLAPPQAHAQWRLLAARYQIEADRLEPWLEVPLNVTIRLDTNQKAPLHARVRYTDEEWGRLAARRPVHRFTLWRLESDGATMRVLEPIERAWPDLEVRQSVRTPGLYWYEVERLGEAPASGRSFQASVHVEAFCRRTRIYYDLDENNDTAARWQTRLLPALARPDAAPLEKTHRHEYMTLPRLLDYFKKALPDGIEVLRRGVVGNDEADGEFNSALAAWPLLRADASLWLNLMCMRYWDRFEWRSNMPRDMLALRALQAHATAQLEHYEHLEKAILDDELDKRREIESEQEAARTLLERLSQTRRLSLEKLRGLALFVPANRHALNDALHELSRNKVPVVRSHLETPQPITWLGRHSSEREAPDAYDLELELQLTLAVRGAEGPYGLARLLLHFRRGSTRPDDAAFGLLVSRVELAWQDLVDAFDGRGIATPDAGGKAARVKRSYIEIDDEVPVEASLLQAFPPGGSPRSLFKEVAELETILAARREFALAEPRHDLLNQLALALAALEDYNVSSATSAGLVN